MKRLLWIIVIFCLLCGCSAGNAGMDRALKVRQKMLDSNGCSFDAMITADYTDSLHVFSMQCCTDSNSDLTFTVTDPDTIEGISGKIAKEGGQILFDDAVLAFPLLAEGQVSPVSSPWLFVKTLKGGYLSGCTYLDDGLLLQIHDSYEKDSLVADIHVNSNNIPVNCEIVWQGRRILSLGIRNFTYL